MPVPTSGLYSPFSRCGIPAANSTTSTPRWMSPRESGSVLPCSEDSSAASESISCATRSRKRIITRARTCGLRAAQPGCAAAASAIAASTSAWSASTTWPCTAPVLGSKISPVCADEPGTRRPPMKWGTR